MVAVCRHPSTGALSPNHSSTNALKAVAEEPLVNLNRPSEPSCGPSCNGVYLLQTIYVGAIAESYPDVGNPKAISEHRRHADNPSHESS
jgi:hypothetical protein